MTVKLDLKRPITIAGETISALEFAEPTGKDLRECGMPYSISTDGKASVIFDTGAVSKLVSRLAKVPPSTVDRLAPVDYMACEAIIMGFFGD